MRQRRTHRFSDGSAFVFVHVVCLKPLHTLGDMLKKTSRGMTAAARFDFFGAPGFKPPRVRASFPVKRSPAPVNFQAAVLLLAEEPEYSIGKRSFILYATSVLLVALTFFMMLRM